MYSADDGHQVRNRHSISSVNVRFPTSVCIDFCVDGNLASYRLHNLRSRSTKHVTRPFTTAAYPWALRTSMMRYCYDTKALHINS